VKTKQFEMKKIGKQTPKEPSTNLHSIIYRFGSIPHCLI